MAGPHTLGDVKSSGTFAVSLVASLEYSGAAIKVLATLRTNSSAEVPRRY
jgi:hypothetical protein